jgi:ribosomal protein L11 methylase PrmA
MIASSSALYITFAAAAAASYPSRISTINPFATHSSNSAFVSPNTKRSRNSGAASSHSLRQKYRNHRKMLNTVSMESNDINLTTEDDDDEPWVLRQITFLGLTAAKSSSVDESGDAESNDDDVRSEFDARNLSEFLMEIGACSVSITDADRDTSEEDPLFHEPSLSCCPNDYVEDANSEFAMILDDKAVGRNLWKKCHVSAHFPSSLFDVPTIVDAVRYTFQVPTNPRFKVDTVPDLDWIQHVQESWNPIVTKQSKFVLRFPWHEDVAVMKACQDAEREKMMESMAKQFSSGVKRDGAVVHFEDDSDDEDTDNVEKQKARDYVQIRLEGGIAFGTGEHPTTRLCLDWVRDKVEMALQNSIDQEEVEPLHFMDYGAGSGVLGIAAAAVIRDRANKTKRQQAHQKDTATVVGVEIDADAIHIANDNSQKNYVEMKNYLPNIESLDDEALSVVLRAMQRERNKNVIQYLPEELSGQIYDLCVANILAGPLVGLVPTISALVKSGGEIGLSGILSTQADNIVMAYDEFFDDVKVAAEEGGWVLITGKRR